MNCRDVDSMADFPLAELSPAERDAADRHAANCRRCGAVLAHSRAVDAHLARLQLAPEVPDTLMAAVLKRTAATGARGDAGSPAREPVSGKWLPRFGWAASFTGFVVALGAQGYLTSIGGFGVDLTTMRIGEWRLFGGWPEAPTELLLGLGLLLMAAGLSGFVSETPSRRRSS